MTHGGMLPQDGIAVQAQSAATSAWPNQLAPQSQAPIFRRPCAVALGVGDFGFLPAGIRLGQVSVEQVEDDFGRGPLPGLGGLHEAAGKVRRQREV